MNKKFFAAIVAGLVWGAAGSVFAAGAPPVQDVGAISTGSVTTVNVGTAPAIILSTGAYMRFPNYPPFDYNVPQTSSTIPTPGQYMPDRLALEIFNGSTMSIFCSFLPNVSTIPGLNYGREIITKNSWSINGSIPCIYCVSGSSTGYTVNATQVK